MSDRVFTIAFGVSLGIHLLLLIGQLLSLDWFSLARQRTIEVVYDQVVAQQELRLLQERLAQDKRETIASPAPSTFGQQTQIRIPDRPSLAADHHLSDIMPDRASIVDLTNLVDAARGDPVLLGYFSAVREQIQQTANAQAWLAGSAGQGLVYVSFVLTNNGAVQGLTIVADRSVDVRILWDVALNIVKNAAPFPPFPPSMAEPSKTIVVPLEFMVGT